MSAMQEAAKAAILIADDEARFATRTAALLEHRGYRCESVLDGASAAERLKGDVFDLLIADINMPGNQQLELVREGPLDGIPVLLVTGTPTLETAIDSFGLSVVGYLVKPVRAESLYSQVEKAIEVSQVRRAVSEARQRLGRWSSELSASDRVAGRAPGGAAIAADAYIESTVRNVTEALIDMARIATGVAGRGEPQTDICRFFACPRLASYREAVEETIEVLEGTKRSFRSKELAVLRAKLELLLKADG